MKKRSSYKLKNVTEMSPTNVQVNASGMDCRLRQEFICLSKENKRFYKILDFFIKGKKKRFKMEQNHFKNFLNPF